MASWFLQKGNQRLGPMTLEDLTQQAVSGQVAPSDLVWGEGMATWEPAGSQPWFPGGSSLAPPPTSTTQYGTLFRGSEAFVETEPPSLIGWSIAVLLCCCLPGGIIGIVYGTKANNQFARGNYAEARAAYETGKNWLIGSAIAGAVINVVYLFLKISQR